MRSFITQAQTGMCTAVLRGSRQYVARPLGSLWWGYPGGEACNPPTSLFLIGRAGLAKAIIGETDAAKRKVGLSVGVSKRKMLLS